jgi:hypothetical protein
MRGLIWLCVTAALTAAAASAGGKGRPVGVYLSFESMPTAASIEIMKDAVEHLLEPAGVTVAWRLTSENSGDESFAQLAVIRFKGTCRSSAPQPPNLFGSVGEVNELATTAASKGHVLPYTDVACDEVRKALTFVRQGTGLVERERALGLALGRVVAHELYHILADTGAHTSEGIAKAVQLLPDLVSAEELKFDLRSSQAIQNQIKQEK